ncbi:MULTISPECIES: hypothetical protein [Halolamina]|uniref:Uncharacterized protein n=1 Tax=Halolamina pelagica TaxID=699431 RepID=A0A1I5V866_9EURY|nr:MULTISPECIES: hypothetical protein [Halolamina]NHX37907.1 hypothetical protein [Halolamina sp. R1-12]SFQ03126.1 hypothetical protein SAMN05216277_11639 [Halolamina pelagica]
MAPIDGLIVGVVSLLVGALAIHIGAKIVLRKDPAFGDAVVAAAVGALAYALLGFIGGIPVVGPVLLLVLWIGIVNWRYPGGWIRAAGIGFAAWLAAIVLLWVLSLANLVELSALGIPGV